MKVSYSKYNLTFLLAIVLSIINRSQTYSCSPHLMLNTCTALNSGTKCYYNRYLNGSTCTLRNNIVPNCIEYLTTNQDSGDCLACRNGYQVYHDARYFI